MTHALFVSLSTEIKIENPHVFLFKDEDSALRFAIDKLIEAGLIERNEDGSIWYADLEEHLGNNAASALEVYQESLGASEYFHIYETTVVE